MTAPPGDFPTFSKMIPDVNLISSSINNYVFPWFLNKKINNSKVLYWFYKVIWMKLTSFSPQCAVAIPYFFSSKNKRRIAICFSHGWDKRIGRLVIISFSIHSSRLTYKGATNSTNLFRDNTIIVTIAGEIREQPFYLNLATALCDVGPHPRF